MTASNRPPGSPDPSLAPEGAREKHRKPEEEGWDEDIPLRSLHDARYRSDDQHRPRPSDIMVDGGIHAGGSMLRYTPSTSGSYSPEVSPFPLNISPFVPSSETDAGEDDDDENLISAEQYHGGGDPFAKNMDRENGSSGSVHERLLSEPAPNLRRTIFAKSSSGGIRWCKKCDTWKPDRCHHCRHCRRCTLKSKSFLKEQNVCWIGLMI